MPAITRWLVLPVRVRLGHVRGRPSVSCRAVVPTDRHCPNALTVGEDGLCCSLQSFEVGGLYLSCR